MWILIAILAAATLGVIVWRVRKENKRKERRARIDEAESAFAKDELVLRAIESETEKFCERILRKARDSHFVYIKVSTTIQVSKEWVCELHLENLGHRDLTGEEAVIVRNLIAREVRKRTQARMKKDPPAKDSEIRVISDRGWVEYTARNGYCEETSAK